MSTGPNSSDSPYLIPVAPGVTNTALLSVGDAADNGYRMVGIPDGLGAYDNGDGTITVLMTTSSARTAVSCARTAEGRLRVQVDH